ncbi:MAG: GFA family protein [Roseovarius sp.]
MDSPGAFSGAVFRLRPPEGPGRPGCRKQSASAFGISVIVPADALELVAGSPATWSRATDRGTGLDCVFCPVCGSRLWHAPDPAKGTVSVKGGSLDTPVDLGEAVHIWTARRLPGVVIPRARGVFRASRSRGMALVGLHPSYEDVWFWHTPGDPTWRASGQP